MKDIQIESLLNNKLTRILIILLKEGKSFSSFFLNVPSESFSYMKFPKLKRIKFSHHKDEGIHIFCLFHNESDILFFSLSLI